MPSPNSNYADLATVAIEQRSKVLSDNLSENSALLDRMKSRGNLKLVSGGTKIIREIMYQGPGNYIRYSGYETLDTSTRQMLTSAEYPWKQAGVTISMSGLEELQTAGPEAFIDYYGAKMDAAEKEMMNNISADLYSLGTASGGKQIGGLQSIVADAGTGTVGGIDSGTYTWWQNKVYDFSNATVTPGPTTMISSMNALWAQLVRGKDMPDLIVMDNTYWGFFLGGLQTIQRITDAGSGASGFKKWRALDYMGTPVVLDGGLGGDAPSAHVYMLNTEYLEFVTHRDRNFTALNGKRLATNQDAFTQFILWAGNLVCSNRSLQGVMIA